MRREEPRTAHKDPHPNRRGWIRHEADPAWDSDPLRPLSAGVEQRWLYGDHVEGMSSRKAQGVSELGGKLTLITHLDAVVIRWAVRSNSGTQPVERMIEPRRPSVTKHDAATGRRRGVLTHCPVRAP